MINMSYSFVDRTGIGQDNKIKFVNKKNSLQNQQFSMQNRHTTQIRQLLSKKRLSNSRFNPESRLLVTSPSMKQSRQPSMKQQPSIKQSRQPFMKQSRQLKKSSSSSFHTDKQKQLQLQVMQKRYQQLYFEYGKMVEQAKKKADMCRKQEEEISKYENAQKRDKKQIERLKSMVGMITKKENGVQTIEDKGNFINQQQYKFVVDQQSQSKKTSKLKESRSCKDISMVTRGINYKDIPMVTKGNNYRITSQNDENHKYNLMNNPMVSSNLINQSSQLLKRNSLVGHNHKQQPMNGNKDQKNYGAKQQLLYSRRDQTDNGSSNVKQMAKRYESSKANEPNKAGDYSKMTESVLYGNKSSSDFRRKKTNLSKGSIDNGEENIQSQLNNHMPNPSFGNQKNSRVNSGNLRVNSPNSRINSPNSRFKFIPSVDIQ